MGPTLALRAGVQDLPDIRIAFAGTGAPQNYELTGARAYDVGAALVVADHSRGWGLGSQAFVGGGRGRIHAGSRTGDRYYAEGGGGLSSGPFGVELSVRFAWNHMTDPVDHHFITANARGSMAAWLQAASEDADRRGLPELKPLLETLARSTVALREADRVVRDEALLADSARAGESGGRSRHVETTE